MPLTAPRAADIMRAWVATTGIGPPRVRSLDLRRMPRCITVLSFCLHFADPKIGSVLVTRCSVSLPPFLLSSISLSLTPLLSVLSRFISRTPRRTAIRSTPKSTSAFLSLVSFTRARCRCSFCPQTQSAASLIRSISERSFLSAISR